MLCNDGWLLVCDWRSACARTRSFLWMCVCLAGFSTRKDLQGVTSIVRALGLKSACYDRLLDLFHSPAVDLHRLTRAWCALVFRAHPGILRVNCRPVLVGDGLKLPKAGRKIPPSRNSIRNPTPTPSRTTSSATPAKPSPCSHKPPPASWLCL